MSKILLAVGIFVGAVFGMPWFVMIAMGNIHSSYPVFPHPGFVTSFWGCFPLSALVSVAAQAAKAVAKEGD
jgi:hypothetical protein